MKSFVILSALIAATHSRVPYDTTTVKVRNSSIATAGSQVMDGYDYANQGGDRVRAIDYIPYLQEYNFDNRMSSVVVTGIWLMYADSKYNNDNIDAASYWIYGDNYATNVPAGFDNMASSVRYTGAPDSWTANTLNLYKNEYFIGGEEYIQGDQPDLILNDQAKSIVVTGCTAWTLYSDTNHRGSCTCVYPSDTSKCFPGFYSTEESVGSLARSVSSVRRGCDCSIKAFPENYLSKTQQNFNL